MAEPSKDEPKPAPAPAPANPPAPAAASAPAPAAAAAPAKPSGPPLTPAQQARQRRVAREKELATKLATRLGDAVVRRESFRDQETIVVDRARALTCLRAAREELGYDFLVDVTAVDYLKLEGPHPERFGVFWTLQSLSQEAQVRLKAYVPEEDPRVASAVSVWAAADWGERECFDMFGIEFTGHPHLRRILMPEDYASFPLRKDYPLRGRGERDNFVVLKRGQSEAEH